MEETGSIKGACRFAGYIPRIGLADQPNVRRAGVQRLRMKRFSQRIKWTHEKSLV